MREDTLGEGQAMRAGEQLLMAEALRGFLAGSPVLPVKGWALGIDSLDADGPSMAMQLNSGRAVKTYLDGSRVMRQPFTLIYRAGTTEDNASRARMIESLNSIGQWMEVSAGLPDLGNRFKATLIEQVDLANIFTQDEKELGYAATYVLEYETR